MVSELSDRTTKIINSVGEHKYIEKETMMTFYSLSQKTQIQRNTHNYKQISHKNYRKIKVKSVPAKVKLSLTQDYVEALNFCCVDFQPEL